MLSTEQLRLIETTAAAASNKLAGVLETLRKAREDAITAMIQASDMDSLTRDRVASIARQIIALHADLDKQRCAADHRRARAAARLTALPSSIERTTESELV